MTEYICRECTGRSGERLVFTVTEGGTDYTHRVQCPVCGQYHTVEETEQ